MIDVELVKKLLSDKEANNIICRELGLRPTSIAFDIAALSNTSFDEAYIVLGAKKDSNGYEVCGLNRRFKVEVVLSKAVELLSDKPKIIYGLHSMYGKNVCIIKISRVEQPIIIAPSMSPESSSQKLKEKFFRDLYLAAAKLQRNVKYRDAIEDERNDYIRDLLETANYEIKDQTRQGTSASGKSAGEIDLLVQNGDLPLCIIEALNLDSLKKDYLNLHIDKIYKYDTLGHTFNIVLSYVEANDFGKFWEKYLAYIKNCNYPHELTAIDYQIIKELDYSDIRYATTRHNRNGMITELIHMCIKIHK